MGYIYMCTCTYTYIYTYQYLQIYVYIYVLSLCALNSESEITLQFVIKSLRSEVGALLQIWEFPKIRDTLFWGPYNEDPIVYGAILGCPIFGNCHVSVESLGLRDVGCRAQGLLRGLGFQGLGVSLDPQLPKPCTLSSKPQAQLLGNRVQGLGFRGLAGSDIGVSEYATDTPAQAGTRSFARGMGCLQRGKWLRGQVSHSGLDPTLNSKPQTLNPINFDIADLSTTPNIRIPITCKWSIVYIGYTGYRGLRTIRTEPQLSFYVYL